MLIADRIPRDPSLTTAPAPQHPRNIETNSPDSGSEPACPIAMPAAQHLVQFYEADPSLLDAVVTYCADAIVAGDVAVVIATVEHRAGIADRLRARNLIDATDNHDRYLAFDAAETLSRFLSDGEIDVARFAQVIGDLISGAAEHGRHVRVFGEMVSLLVETGNPAAAIQLEELWNDLQQRGTHPFTLLCAYPLAEFGGEAQGQLFRDVCETHSRVIPTESVMAAQDENHRLRAIAELQQKAQSLEAEIAERQRVEERLQAALTAEQSARRESDDALHVRDEFLSIAAHELRNPLASLSLHAQVALRRLSHDTQVDTARTECSLLAISDQATRLSHLLPTCSTGSWTSRAWTPANRPGALGRTGCGQRSRQE